MIALHGITNGIDFRSQDDDLKNCEACIQGKQAALAFPKGIARRAKQLLELVHSDVCGPMSVDSCGGARYFVTFKDDHSRKTFGYLIKRKSEIMSCFIKFKNFVEKQTGYSVKCLRSGNGGEYFSNKFINYLSGNGILHQSTVFYTPQRNGVSERLNRTLMQKVRCMLTDSKLNNRYWGENFNTALYLKNRNLTAALFGHIPEEIWSESKVNLSHLRIFGCKAYVLIPDSKRQKLDEKSYLCVLLDTVMNPRVTD